MPALRDYQREAVDFLLPKKRAFIQAPAGSGKTYIAASAIAERAWSGCRVVWLANTREQVEQGIAAIQKTDGPPGVDFEVCCVAAQPDTSTADIIVFDEAHHAPAATWSALLGRAKPGAIVWGFSATPWSGDTERDEFLEETFVDFFTIERSRLEEAGHLEKGKVYVHDLDLPGQWDAEIDSKVAFEVERRFRRYPVLMDIPKVLGLTSRLKALASSIRQKAGPSNLKLAATGQLTEAQAKELGIDTLIAQAATLTQERNDLVRKEHRARAQWQISQEYLQANENRNAKAVQIATEESAAGESVLVLVHSIEHGGDLAARVPGASLVHSKLPTRTRRSLIEAFREGSQRVLFATSLADEGLDVPRASRLVLVAGGRAAGKLEQRAGRVLRPFEGKNGGIVFDFLDRGILFAHQQAKARFRVYDKLGYQPEIVSYGQKAA